MRSTLKASVTAVVLVSCGGQTIATPPDASPMDAHATDVTPEAGSRCEETIAQACAPGSKGLPASPCTTKPDQFAIDWQTDRETCLFFDCGDWIIVGLEGPPDSDDYSYLFDAKSGALLEVDVSSWSLGKIFCLAGPAQPYPTPSNCPSRSCNAACSVTPDDCSPLDDGRVCGPTTTMTSCSGPQQSFPKCDCNSGAWECTAEDGGLAFFAPCDAGTD